MEMLTLLADTGITDIMTCYYCCWYCFLLLFLNQFTCLTDDVIGFSASQAFLLVGLFYLCFL